MKNKKTSPPHAHVAAMTTADKQLLNTFITGKTVVKHWRKLAKHWFNTVKVVKVIQSRLKSKYHKLLDRYVRDQFLHVETETETQCTQSQFLILRLRLLELVSNFETETETL